MKTLLQFFIVAMFGIEICSPFFIGYLNHQQQKVKKIYSTQEIKNKIAKVKAVVVQAKQAKDWRSVDFTDNNYSDSKTLSVKE